MSERSYVRGIGKPSTFQVDLPEPNVVKCVVCYHHCILEPGHRGICGTRHNYRGTLYSMVDTRPCSLHLDPIEKKPLYHFYPGTKIYSIGTVGCNMRCSFCQNWQTSQAPKGSSLDLEEVSERLYSRKIHGAEDAVSAAARAGCNSIAYTYNEPTIFADFIFDTAKLAHSRGIKNVLVTNGYQSLEFIERLAPYIDACNIDLKTIRNAFYSKLCGTRIQPILRNIRIWRELGVWVEITTLLIPGENDTVEEITKLAQFLVDVDPALVWHVSSYRDAFRMHGKGRTPLTSLKRAHRIGKKLGLKYIYLGNVSNPDTATTWCEKCRNKLVSRNHWGRGGVLVGLDGTNGTCRRCHTVIPGIWTDQAQNLYVPARTTRIPPHLTVVPLADDLMFPDEDSTPVVRILFATQTGVSEEYAMALAAEGRNRGVQAVQAVDMERYDEASLLPRERVVVLVLSTFFYGRIPRNGDRFMEYIRAATTERDDSDVEMVDDDAPPPLLSLAHLRYALFGIGSTGTRPEHLETYQVIARELDERMSQLGARSLCPRGEGNKKEAFLATLEQWKATFWNAYATWVASGQQ